MGNLLYTYYIKETKAPSGYKIDDESTKTVTVCYTTNSNDLKGQGFGEEALYDGTVSGLAFTDTKNPVYIRIVKVDLEGNALSGAVFSSNPNFQLTESDVNGIMFDGQLENETYTLTETTSPPGFNMMNGDAVITVNEDNITWIQSDYNNGESQTALLLDGDQEASETNPYVVYIHNALGAELPATGGMGIVGYVSGGMGIAMMSLMSGGLYCFSSVKLTKNCPA